MADIEYFYSAHSSFAYLGSARFMEIAAAGNHRIIHKPIDLGLVVEATGPGWSGDRTPSRRDYFFGRDKQHWGEFRSVPIMDRRPAHHDNDMALANGMIIAGLEQGVDVDALAHAMLEAHWRDDADLAVRETLAGLGQPAGLDPEPLLDAAISPEIQAIYKANSEEAIERSVFGSPTYFVDGDMFYGQDRLELVERALEKPFAGSWPRQGDHKTNSPQLSAQLSISHAADSRFEQGGLRSFFEYRDLGIRDATQGAAGAHVIRARPGKHASGEKHTHRLQFQMVYVLKGWVRFWYEGHGEVRLEAGSCVHQPSGIQHQELEHSDDIEMIEITLPASFETELVE